MTITGWCVRERRNQNCDFFFWKEMSACSFALSRSMHPLSTFNPFTCYFGYQTKAGISSQWDEILILSIVPIKAQTGCLPFKMKHEHFECFVGNGEPAEFSSTCLHSVTFTKQSLYPRCLLFFFLLQPSYSPHPTPNSHPCNKIACTTGKVMRLCVHVWGFLITQKSNAVCSGYRHLLPRPHGFKRGLRWDF